MAPSTYENTGWGGGAGWGWGWNWSGSTPSPSPSPRPSPCSPMALGATRGDRYKNRMRITMVKKRLRDGSECRKCAQATQQLESRGLMGRIDEVLETREGDSASPAAQLAARFGIDTA